MKRTGATGAQPWRHQGAVGRGLGILKDGRGLFGSSPVQSQMALDVTDP